MFLMKTTTLRFIAWFLGIFRPFESVFAALGLVAANAVAEIRSFASPVSSKICRTLIDLSAESYQLDGNFAVLIGTLSV